MKEKLRKLVRGSVPLSALNYFKGQVLFRAGLRGHQSGATLSGFSVEESIDYALGCFEDYLRYAGVGPDFVHGKRILEVGPGDSLGVALCFVAHGAASVTALDRFYSARDSEVVSKVHEGLLARLPESGRERARQGLEDALSEDGNAAARGPLRYVHGIPIEKATRKLSEGGFDVIVSRAVLEHVYDLRSAWQSMGKLLDDGGEMWHKVDLRAHTMFVDFHPLMFLKFSDTLWKLISSPDPTLNRERRHTYQELCEGSFPEYRIFTTHLLENDEILPHVEEISEAEQFGSEELAAIAEIRPRLARRFRDLSDRELLTTGIFAIASRGRSLGPPSV